MHITVTVLYFPPDLETRDNYSTVVIQQYCKFTHLCVICDHNGIPLCLVVHLSTYFVSPCGHVYIHLRISLFFHLQILSQDSDSESSRNEVLHPISSLTIDPITSTQYSLQNIANRPTEVSLYTIKAT